MQECLENPSYKYVILIKQNYLIITLTLRSSWLLSLNISAQFASSTLSMTQKSIYHINNIYVQANAHCS